MNQSFMAAISWYTVERDKSSHYTNNNINNNSIHTNNNHSNTSKAVPICGLNNLQLRNTSKAVPICGLNNLQLRFLCPSDLKEVQALCQDWFPIDYPLSWYKDITSEPSFYSLAAIYNGVIIGLIVAEIRQYNSLNKEDRDILAASFDKHIEVGYILSLGVSENYRRNGIASLLLENLISHLTTAENSSCKAIFLHVLTSNAPAIHFYEKRRFRLHSFLPYYYSIKGRSKDGFGYVLYINGGHPAWSLCDYVKHWCESLYRMNVSSWLYKRLTGAVHWVWPGMRRVVSGEQELLFTNSWNPTNSSSLIPNIYSPNTAKNTSTPNETSSLDELLLLPNNLLNQNQTVILSNETLTTLTNETLSMLANQQCCADVRSTNETLTTLTNETLSMLANQQCCADVRSTNETLTTLTNETLSMLANQQCCADVRSTNETLTTLTNETLSMLANQQCCADVRSTNETLTTLTNETLSMLANQQCCADVRSTNETLTTLTNETLSMLANQQCCADVRSTNETLTTLTNETLSMLANQQCCADVRSTNETLTTLTNETLSMLANQQCCADVRSTNETLTTLTNETLSMLANQQCCA
ncbi:hypothetical protein WDU94_006247 [Cyamophila willieti]